MSAETDPSGMNTEAGHCSTDGFDAVSVTTAPLWPAGPDSVAPPRNRQPPPWMYVPEPRAASCTAATAVGARTARNTTIPKVFTMRMRTSLSGKWYLSSLETQHEALRPKH